MFMCHRLENAPGKCCMLLKLKPSLITAATSKVGPLHKTSDLHLNATIADLSLCLPVSLPCKDELVFTASPANFSLLDRAFQTQHNQLCTTNSIYNALNVFALMAIGLCFGINLSATPNDKESVSRSAGL